MHRYWSTALIHICLVRTQAEVRNNLTVMIFLQPVVQPLNSHRSGTSPLSLGLLLTHLGEWLVTHLITWVATDPEFNDKTVYTTLGRTLGPFNKMGTFLLDVFAQYNWRKVVVISSNFFLWLDAGKAIRKVNMHTNN